MSYVLEEPEGMLGLMLAFEGLSDSVTIVHGPTGCKQYPADLSERSFRARNGEFVVRDLFNFKRRFLFYQPRIPCTYLDGDTFVSGAAERLNELYDITVSDRPGIIGIINSPGASLIGEDLTRLKSDILTVGFESPGFSLPFGEGFQNGVIGIIDALAMEPGKKKGVFVLTFNCIKGLEFDAVIIPRCESIAKSRDEEERISNNKFYVAMTRASEAVLCFYFSMNSKGQKIDVFGPLEGHEDVVDWE